MSNAPQSKDSGHIQFIERVTAFECDHNPLNLNLIMSRLRSVLEWFTNSASSNVEAYANRSVTLNLPRVPGDVAIEICQKASQLFKDEPVVLELRSPYVIIGDLHGHILDLYRILNTLGYPPRRKYLFLGDIVDRGEFSVETVLFVFLLKIMFPDDVQIIRGNHEFRFLSQECGFLQQCVDVYAGIQVYEECLKVFSFLPMAARIDGRILCVHGGIGPHTRSLSQFLTVPKPLTDFSSDFVDDVLWSDPSEECDRFEPSSRGTGYFFGEKALRAFLANTKIDVVVRGHECVSGGVQWMFDKHLVTVFSASNYCGIAGNQAGVLEVEPGLKFHDRQFPPLDYLLRNHVMFKKKPNDKDEKIPRKALGLSTKAASAKDVQIPNSKLKEAKHKSCKHLPRLALESRGVKASSENSTPLPSLGGRVQTSRAYMIRPPTVAALSVKRRITYQ